MVDELAALDAATGMPEGIETGTADDCFDAKPAVRSSRGYAVRMLCQRGFRYVGEDSLRLPCFRSPSGSLVVSVGSHRCLAYRPEQGRLALVASVRTSVLVCRIVSNVEALPAEPPRKVLIPFRPDVVAQQVRAPMPWYLAGEYGRDYQGAAVDADPWVASA